MKRNLPIRRALARLSAGVAVFAGTACAPASDIPHDADDIALAGRLGENKNQLLAIAAVTSILFAIALAVPSAHLLDVPS